MIAGKVMESKGLQAETFRNDILEVTFMKDILMSGKETRDLCYIGNISHLHAPGYYFHFMYKRSNLSQQKVLFGNGGFL